MKKTDVIKAFLHLNTHPDLARLYHHGMECQINVAQDNGAKVTGEYKGRNWHAWTDGVTTWKSFRIPYNAKTDPTYVDGDIKYDFDTHVEGIGMTGWNWIERRSDWVAFDFDSIIGHSKGLTAEQLSEIQNKLSDISWVTIRKSTGGKGLHVYVFLSVLTDNHVEHAAVARSVLGKISALTGYSFENSVDICGGNMWVWHRKMRNNPDGLQLIKEGTILDDVPANWRDHLKVVTGHRRKSLPSFVSGDENVDKFDRLAGQRPIVGIDAEHQRLIDWLHTNECVWWWDEDHNMLVTHTIHLRDAHRALDLRGSFDTTSTGKDKGMDHNCFLFPLRHGAWAVRRYQPGVQEHESWEQDGSGWTRCFFNKTPDLKAAAKSQGAVESVKGDFIFNEMDVARQALRMMGVTSVDVPDTYRKRPTELKLHKDGRVIVRVERRSSDDALHGWLSEGDRWTRIYSTPHINDANDVEGSDCDDIIRHLVSSGNTDYGWVIKSDDIWRFEPLAHIKMVLASYNYKPVDVNNTLGIAIQRAWRVVNKPFQPEYPGDREWNINAAQLKFTPSLEGDSLSYPHWQRILEHCGSGIDVSGSDWAKRNAITCGADYLKCWIAALLQFPSEPLPYLFFYGPQNSGKSTFHEALSLLFTRGTCRADVALTNAQSFNKELEGTVLCTVEETDLNRNKTAYNRIKDWVTSQELLIHEKNRTPYTTRNTTHWVQCSNDANACPVFPGDTRIVMCFVDDLPEEAKIPRRDLWPILEKEAPDFIAELLALDVPRTSERLILPVIDSITKQQLTHLNDNILTDFINMYCTLIGGHVIKYGEFWDAFIQVVPIEERGSWGKKRFGLALTATYPSIVKGRRSDGQHAIGNIAWKKDNPQPNGTCVLNDNGIIEVKQ